MKKSKMFLFSVILFLLTACAGRVPFKAQEPLADSALVYIYVSSDVGDNESVSDSYYRFYINNKLAKEKIQSGEYIALNLKAHPIKISVAKAAFEEHSQNISLMAGVTYYFRVKSNLDNDAFEFIQVSDSIGAKEIVKTGLAGSTAIDEKNIITEYVGVQEKETIQKMPSKADEIQRLYDMKEKGIITQEEYKTLKAKVIN